MTLSLAMMKLKTEDLNDMQITRSNSKEKEETQSVPVNTILKSLLQKKENLCNGKKIELKDLSNMLSRMSDLELIILQQWKHSQFISINKVQFSVQKFKEER